jgi:RNA polymerase sigma factor (sigma-70 family)
MIQKERIEQLFRCYYQEMYRLAMIFLHDDAESKDVISEIFVQLMDRESDLEADKEKAFLMASVRNRCLNIIRNKSLQQRIQRLYLLDIQTDIRPIESIEAELENISHCIEAEIPENDRRILLFHYHERLTYKEIARREKISEVAVYKHLHKALDVLRNYLKKQNENG